MATCGRTVTDPTVGRWETSFTSSLRSRSKALEGRMASRESLFAAGGNVVNPMVVSRAQQTCTVGKEQAVGVVRNHKGGTRSELGSNDPKARRWQHRFAGGNTGEPLATPPSREWTPRASTTEGRIFGKPQERNSDVSSIGTLGPEGVGIEARKVKRVDRISCLRR